MKSANNLKNVRIKKSNTKLKKVVEDMMDQSNEKKESSTVLGTDESAQASKIQRMRDCLIWLKENVVQGNEDHVKRIENCL